MWLAIIETGALLTAIVVAFSVIAPVVYIGLRLAVEIIRYPTPFLLAGRWREQATEDFIQRIQHDSVLLALYWPWSLYVESTWCIRRTYRYLRRRHFRAQRGRQGVEVKGSVR